MKDSQFWSLCSCMATTGVNVVLGFTYPVYAVGALALLATYYFVEMLRAANKERKQ